ncbi:MAG TPA: hypothetical protein VHE09_16785 [Rhizomicrobium sp.]|nr:hypothetical protein [Rhizomicrobium sp.]
MSARLLLVTSDPAIANTVRAALDVTQSLITLDRLTMAGAGEAYQPSAILIDSDVRGGVHTTFEKIEAAKRGFPTTPVIVLGNEMSAQLVLVALRAGADEFVDREAGADQLRIVLRGCLTKAKDSPHPSRAKVAGVLAGLPGDLDQDFARNLAVRAAKHAPGEMTLYIDLALPVSQAGIGLGLQPGFCVGDAIREVARIDRAWLESALVRHEESGLYLLPLAPASGSDIPVLDSASFGALLQVLRALCHAIIVGYGPFSQERTLLEMAQPNARWFLCCDQRFASIRRSGEIRQWLTANGLGAPEIVVHALAPGLTPDPSDIRRALDVQDTIDLDVSWDALAESLNGAKPLALSDARYARGLDACLAPLGLAPQPQADFLAQLRSWLNPRAAAGSA